MHSVIQKILERNKEVEVELLLNTDSNLMEDVNIKDFFLLTPAEKLEDFIHAQKFKANHSKEQSWIPLEKNEQNCLPREKGWRHWTRLQRGESLPSLARMEPSNSQSGPQIASIAHSQYKFNDAKVFS